jgi:hypothetical protein
MILVGNRPCQDLFEHLITATAINVVRVAAWLEGMPRAHTRRSLFAALAA